jgi:outer membrane protein assembly factor BamB
VHRSRTTISCRVVAQSAALTVAWLVAATPAAALPNDPPLFPSKIVWSIEIASGPVAPPVLAGGVVVVALRSGQVAAWRVDDGAPVWSVELAATTDLAAADDLVLVPARDELHALALDSGRTRWTKRIGPMTAPPLLRGGWVIAATGERLSALRAADGAEVWSREMPPIEHRPAIDGDTLYVSVTDGRLVALDLRTGTPRWEFHLGPDPSEPFPFGDRVYAGSGEGYFFCLKIADGKLDWSARIGTALRGTAAGDATRVYTASMDNLLRAFRRSNGTNDWKQDIGYRPAAGPVALGTTVAVPGRTTTVRAYDTGGSRRVVAELKLPDPAVMTGTAAGAANDGDTVRWAIVTGDPGRPWLLNLAGPPPPTLPAPMPLTVLPGVSLPAPRPPGL